jgi:hypothetical protein
MGSASCHSPSATTDGSCDAVETRFRLSNECLFSRQAPSLGDSAKNPAFRHV